MLRREGVGVGWGLPPPFKVSMLIKEKKAKKQSQFIIDRKKHM
jgi:hypothetical protein